MSGAIITVENLSKSYLVGHRLGGQSRSNYTALRDVIGREVRNVARRAIDVVRGRQVVQGDEVEEFWALKDVSFEVKRGEVLGIIGRNGSGKSTLLKILSRITEPTRGRVQLRGRVASLLEVGTGFHPELTGRENIFLNGAILGMTRREIRTKFDEIVAFAEVEKFLDTPVKHYSSGMYVRLAFSVAAHLEPEILIVDEVLAVGDGEFQRKCLGKMQDFASTAGRTVLFVSHNMAAIEGLCGTGLLLADGACVTRGPIDGVVQEYLHGMSRLWAVPLHQRTDREGSGGIRFVSVTFEGQVGQKLSAFQCGAKATLRLEIDCFVTQARHIVLSVGINDAMGQRLLLLDSAITGTHVPDFTFGRHVLRFIIPRMPLVPARYTLTLYASINDIVADWIRNACFLDIESGDFYGSGRLPLPAAGGVFLADHTLGFAKATDANISPVKDTLVSPGC
jgi:lipopolysaccharide transport system ATP-binding protein